MGQPDLASNGLISHPDVFADIVNTIVYDGEAVLDKNHLRPFYLNNSVVKNNGKLRGLYRDNCMEDIRSGTRYIIWGLENQYVPDLTTPFKVMGYDFAAYDRQIEEFSTVNKQLGNEAYAGGLLPGQKLKPVITLVLYYGNDDIPGDICSMMDIPENQTVRKYIQNYHLNLICLAKLSEKQAGQFQSDFSFIAKFLRKSYNKQKQLEDLKNGRQVLIHTKDTLFTMAAITKDSRYLKIIETSREESKMCEIAEALEKIGYDNGKIEDRAEVIIEDLEDIGTPSEKLRKFIMSQTDLGLLREWHRAAVRAASIEEFEKAIGI